MQLTNESLSVWELAHRMVGENPYHWRPFGLPPAVKDAARLLMNEILEAHLESILIMDKRRRDSDEPPEYFIQTHLDAIYACIGGHRFPRRMLKLVVVDRWAFGQWCKQARYPLPDFWFAVDYQWPRDEENETDGGGSAGEPAIDAAPITQPEKLAPAQRTKVACQEIAKRFWKETPDTTIADMLKRREILELGGGSHYAEKTLRAWLSQVAPPEIKGRRGRPRKLKTEFETEG